MTTQEQLSQRVAEVVRLEHTIRKQQMELKTLRERNATNEDELTDQKATIGRRLIFQTHNFVSCLNDKFCSMFQRQIMKLVCAFVNNKLVKCTFALDRNSP